LRGPPIHRGQKIEKSRKKLKENNWNRMWRTLLGTEKPNQ